MCTHSMPQVRTEDWTPKPATLFVLVAVGLLLLPFLAVVAGLRRLGR